METDPKSELSVEETTKKLQTEIDCIETEINSMKEDRDDADRAYYELLRTQKEVRVRQIANLKWEQLKSKMTN